VVKGHEDRSSAGSRLGGGVRDDLVPTPSVRMSERHLSNNVGLRVSEVDNVDNGSCRELEFNLKSGSGIGSKFTPLG
jgi:hypothetical protein